MKRKKLFLATTLVMTMLASTSVFADENVGKMINGRTMIPLRGAFTDLGFDVSWDKATNTATLKDDNHVIKVKKDDVNFTVDGQTYQSDVPPKLINGSIYIPLRALGEPIGADIFWDDQLQIASIAYEDDMSYIALGLPPKITASNNRFEPDAIMDFVDFQNDMIDTFNTGIDYINYDGGSNYYATSYFEEVSSDADYLKTADFSNVSKSVKANIVSFADYSGKAADAYIAFIAAFEEGDYDEASVQADLIDKYTLLANLYFDTLIDFFNNTYAS